jgi:drug/metabolite transporter (DMT)-like permease
MSAAAADRWRPVVALAALTLIWGYTWIVVKQGLGYAPPFAFAAHRSAGAGIALFLALKLSGRPLRLAAPGMTLAIALVQVSAFMVLQTWALIEGGAGKTAVLVYTMPIWTLLLGWSVLRERIRGPQWLAAAFALTGLILIIEPWDMHSSALSKALAIMAALAWAIGNLLIKRLRAQQKVDLLALTAWQLMLGAVPLAILAAVMPERPTDWAVPYVAILAFISIVGTALCWWLWNYILDRLPAWEASLSVLGTPVVALASSHLMLGEAFNAPEILGIGLIGAGLALLSFVGWWANRVSP